ncbi:MAG: MFS transporter [Vampirovibrionales bacterium]|nr:MFS transporter [Vampirovibrionales bacterium]
MTPFLIVDNALSHSDEAASTALTSESQAKDSLTEGVSLSGSTYRPVLRNRHFLALWLGQMASQLGDRIVFVVFIAAITANFGANDGYNSLLYIAFTIPAITLTAIAGVLVDRWPRRAVLVSTNVLRAAAVAFLPWVIQGGLGGILAIAALISIATQFFVPAEAATIPAIVPKQHLMAANGLFTTTMMASVVFGFALGDPLVGLFGLESVHWAIVGLFVLASLLVAGVTVPPHPKLTEATSLEQGLWAPLWNDLKEGVCALKDHPPLLNSMIHLAILFSAVVALCILFISFARTYLYEDPVMAVRRFAYIVSVSGIGMSLGALGVPRLSKVIHPQHLVSGGFLLVSACLGLLLLVSQINNEPITMLQHWPWLTSRVLTTYGLALVMGMGASAVAIPLQTRIQHLMDDTMRGKMMGIQFTLLSTSSTVPVLLAGYGVAWLGLVPVWLGLALLLAAIGLETAVKPWTETISLPSPSSGDSALC